MELEELHQWVRRARESFDIRHLCKGVCCTELVRYIHLNPLWAGIADNPLQLDRHPWCGHAVALAKCKAAWQHREYVLNWFDKTEGPVKRACLAFVKRGIALGQQAELIAVG